jgi:pimeloyl-ACP methyl ester carboxylesterase
MPMITMSDDTHIYYKDWGPKNAQPIVFHHGPPAATGRKFTVRRSDVRSPHENRYLAIFQTAGKSG